MEKEYYIWRENIFFRGEQKQERKMRNRFGDGNYVFLQGRRLIVEEKDVYLEKGYMFFSEEKNNREGKGRSVARGRSIRMIICKRPVHPDDHLQEAG